MSRVERFKGYADHAWLGRAYRRLRPEEIAIAEGFIADHDGLDRGEFEFAVNRMFLDRPKPKNFTIILELLTCCNSVALR